MSNDLTVIDVLTYFFEEVFRDGVYEDDEKDMILQLRRQLSVPPDKFLSTMKEVDARFRAGELEYRERSIENDNLEIYRRILVKAFEDNKITPDEETLVLKIAELLSIGKSDHEKIKQEHGLKITEQAGNPEEKSDVIHDLGEDADSLLTEEDIISFLEMG